VKRVPGRERRSLIKRWLESQAGKVALVLATTLAAGGFLALTYAYFYFGRLVDEKLAEGPIEETARLFTAPSQLRPGDDVSAEEIVDELEAAGYSTSPDNPIGWYRVRPDGIEVHPGRNSYFHGRDAFIALQDAQVTRIRDLNHDSELEVYFLEPRLVTHLSGRNRDKRRLVKFEQLPPHLVNAILAAEDKRFFQHAGFDPIRVVKAALVNLREERITQGASTLTMQLAGDLWLNRQERTWRRKAAEALVTLHLERKLTKQQIFEYYVNHIYLGRVGSYNIRGFGEAARAYFNKDVRDLTLAEAALLAGLPRGPSIYNPFRHPDRAKARRNWVLEQMLENDMISEEDYRRAVAAPLGVVQGSFDVGDAPYFVDLVNQWLQKNFPGHDVTNSEWKVYTTLDMNLQQAAVEAVQVGLRELDERCRQLGRTPEKGWPPLQVALVAVDPRTGAVRALVGGRSYAETQLNRALSLRQPGSVFKPFVYAAAINTALEGGPQVFTPVSRILDAPATFWYDGKPYEPTAYKGEYYGEVSLRFALAKSLNVATVRLAEQVGYERVVELARKAGFDNLAPTPAVALGAYDATPLQVAGAYTVFANRGIAARLYFVERVVDEQGRVIYQGRPKTERVLDERVASVMVDLMQEVIRSGTGARVRRMGFDLPAAGKTGTSRDGWFAGFTSELLCVVWVGYDDHRDIKLEGAQSALPIWTEFMKRAHRYRPYRHARPFELAEGVVAVDIDSVTGKLWAPGCPGEPVREVFIAGTQPLESCGQAVAQVLGWEVAPAEGATETQPAPKLQRRARKAPRPATPPPAPAPVEKKKSFFQRLLDMFR